MINDFQKTFKVYEKSVAILLPLLLLTSILVIIDYVPYLNLFKETISILILSLDWFVFVFLSKIRSLSMVKVAFVLLLATYILFSLKLQWYAESLANLSYIILCTAVMSEIICAVRGTWTSQE